MSSADQADKTQDIADNEAQKDGLGGTQAEPAEKGAADQATDTATDLLKSSYSKRCVHCGKRSKMRVVKDADPIESFPWAVRLLLRTFSPGGLELNKRYQCPRCGRNFNDMSVWEALAAPIMLVAFMLALLLGFFWFVFVIVPAR